MPQDEALREHVNAVIAESAQSEGLPLIGFRDVPVDNSSLSKAPDIAAAEPFHCQVFIGRPAEILDDEEYEARLYVLRKVISGRIYAENENRDIGAYCVSLSARTIVYKGMFLAYQLGAYYKDLPTKPSRAPGARASALFDQHLPVVEAGPSLPDGCAQWRDQHHPRQRQLDGGAPGLGRSSPKFGDDISQALADLL
jgi:hypothetical protein